MEVVGGMYCGHLPGHYSNGEMYFGKQAVQLLLSPNVMHAPEGLIRHGLEEITRKVHMNREELRMICPPDIRKKLPLY